MTTPQDATEALARAMDVLAFHMMGRHPGDEHAPAIAAALAADGWSVVRTEDVERWRRVEAAAGDIAELVPMYSETFDTGPDMAALRAVLGDPS